MSLHGNGKESVGSMNDTKPRGFRKNMENIWYHYKYVILVALAALLMFSVAFAQSFSKKEPDISVYHISTVGLTASSQDNFRESMKLIADDYNGDGRVVIDFKEEVYVPEKVNANPNELSASDRFNLELALGDCVIYIMDGTFYRGNKDYMCTLESVLGYLPDCAYDECAIRLCDLSGYANIPGLRDFDEDSYLCLRKKRSGMDEAVYAAHADYFKKLVEFTDFH